MDLDLDRLDAEGPFECASCGVVSTTLTSGWRGAKTTDPEPRDSSKPTLFCTDCAEREFGATS